MKTIKENVSYLQGLVEGVNLNATTNEGRVIKGIIDTIESLAEAVERLEGRQADLEVYLDSLDEELMDIEEEIYQGEGKGTLKWSVPSAMKLYTLTPIF